MNELKSEAARELDSGHGCSIKCVSICFSPCFSVCGSVTVPVTRRLEGGGDLRAPPVPSMQVSSWATILLSMSLEATSLFGVMASISSMNRMHGDELCPGRSDTDSVIHGAVER